MKREFGKISEKQLTVKDFQQNRSIARSLSECYGRWYLRISVEVISNSCRRIHQINETVCYILKLSCFKVALFFSPCISHRFLLLFNTHLRVSLCARYKFGLTIFLYALSSNKALEQSVKKGRSKVIIENGQITKLTKDQHGISRIIKTMKFELMRRS